MSFRGGGRGRGGRGRGGGGFRGGGGRGGGRGGYGNRNFDQGPPEQVMEIGHMTHICEEDLVCKSDIDKIPYFNAPIYLQNKQQIGKVDEIFGPIKDFYFSVKLSENMKASSFDKSSKFYIDPAKLLPLQRFLPRPPGQRGAGKRGGGDRGRGRGGFDRGRGRGGFDRGRGRGGFDRGRGRGGFDRGRGRGGGGFNRGGGGFNRGRGGFNSSFGGGGDGGGQRKVFD